MSFADHLADLVAGDRAVVPHREGVDRTFFKGRPKRERSWPFDWDSEPRPGRTRRWTL